MEQLIGKVINRIQISSNRRYICFLVDGFSEYLFFEAKPGCGCPEECIFIDVLNHEFIMNTKILSVTKSGDDRIFRYILKGSMGEGSLIIKSSDISHNEGTVRYMGSVSPSVIDTFVGPHALFPLATFKNMICSPENDDE